MQNQWIYTWSIVFSILLIYFSFILTYCSRQIDLIDFKIQYIVLHSTFFLQFAEFRSAKQSKRIRRWSCPFRTSSSRRTSNFMNAKVMYTLLVCSILNYLVYSHSILLFIVFLAACQIKYTLIAEQFAPSNAHQHEK